MVNYQCVSYLLKMKTTDLKPITNRRHTLILEI